MLKPLLVYGYLCLNPGEHTAMWHLMESGKRVLSTIVPAGGGAVSCFPKGHPLRFNGAIGTTQDGDMIYCRMFDNYEDCQSAQKNPLRPSLK